MISKRVRFTPKEGELAGMMLLIDKYMHTQLQI